MSQKTKSRLYIALILSILLYNAEILPFKRQDFKALEGAHFQMLRRMMNLDADDTHLSLQEILRTFKMLTIEYYVSQQRMLWVGHALTQPDYDKSKIAVQMTLKNEDSTRTKLV